MCVYPNLVPTAKNRLAGSGVKVASVATAFPSGQSPLDVKVRDVEDAVALGADEIDMVIDRGAFLSGRYGKVLDEIVAIKEACGVAHLKVILETGELGTYDNVRRASLLAIAGGADFIKTSTGKVAPAATLPVTLCMLEVIRDVHAGREPASTLTANAQSGRTAAVLTAREQEIMQLVARGMRNREIGTVLGISEVFWLRAKAISFWMSSMVFGIATASGISR